METPRLIRQLRGIAKDVYFGDEYDKQISEILVESADRLEKAYKEICDAPFCFWCANYDHVNNKDTEVCEECHRLVMATGREESLWRWRGEPDGDD